MNTNDSFDRFDLNSDYIDKEELKLTAIFYSSDVISSNRSLQKLKETGISIRLVDDFINEINRPGRFNMINTSKSKGISYISPSDTFMFPLTSNKYIIGYSDDLEIKDKELLITCSGSVGRSLISNRLLKNFIVSSDMIRIKVNEENLGYIFAFLNSSIGQSLIKKDEYGATVKHIEPYHISNIPIPDIPVLKKEINKKILEAHKLREDAHFIFLKAKELFYEKLNLPQITEDDVNYPEINKMSNSEIRAFEISSNNLNLRLDASYHIPSVELILNELYDNKKNKKGEIYNFVSLAKISMPKRFKRLYVNDVDSGVPLLQGKHISQIKPQGLKFIWNQTKDLNDLLIKENWILITRSGTVGKLSLVSKYWDGWAASDHLLRVIVDEKKINPGFFAMFLSSEYGQIQLKRLTYGAVVDEIGEAGDLINDIKIYKPTDEKIENEIGALFIEAYTKRDLANKIEDETINYLESDLKRLTTS